MPRGKRNNIKRVDELQPGEFVFFGSFWMKVESVEPGEMSKHVDERLAIVRGWINPWVKGKAYRSTEFTEPHEHRGAYMSSGHRWSATKPF